MGSKGENHKQSPAEPLRLTSDTKEFETWRFGIRDFGTARAPSWCQNPHPHPGPQNPLHNPAPRWAHAAEPHPAPATRLLRAPAPARDLWDPSGTATAGRHRVSPCPAGGGSQISSPSSGGATTPLQFSRASTNLGTALGPLAASSSRLIKCN